MSDNKFLNLYKAGTLGVLVTAGAQLWLGFHGNPELFATGLSTLALAIVPGTAAVRLDGQVKTGALTKDSPVEAIAKGVDQLAAAKEQALSDFDKGVDIVAALAKGDLTPLTKELLNIK